MTTMDYRPSLSGVDNLAGRVTGRADMPMSAREQDAELRQAVTSAQTWLRVFYVVVLVIALAGQASGSMEQFDLHWLLALGVALPLELGAIVVLHNADVRRRLNESATMWRLLSAGISLGSVTWAMVSHADHRIGGFFAGFSLLGYVVYLLASEAKRRDRLRALGQLPPTTPAYELVGHWLRHPMITRRARALARRSPALGLYGSVDAAREAIRRERQEAAIAAVLHRKIRSTVDRDTADIAVAVYDLNQIAARLAASADYAGLTALIAADLAPARIAAATTKSGATPPAVPAGSGSLVDTGELGRLLDGLLPGVAPVSPAPNAPARSPQRTSVWTASDSEVDIPLDPPTIPDRTGDRTSADRGPDLTPDADRTSDRTSVNRKRTSARTSGQGTPTAVKDLLPVAREVAAELRARGQRVSRATLAPALRERGVAVSTTGAGALAKALKGRNEPRKARRTPAVARAWGGEA